MSEVTQHPTERQVAIMEAIFALCDAIGHGTTTEDILGVMRLAVADGHGMMCIQLTMAAHAAGLLNRERNE